jgi:glutathione S-transferase
VLIATAPFTSATVTEIGSWSALRAKAGAPQATRLFDAKERLFGAKAPDVIFWRDSSGWCPFCEMTWLLLEELEVPYRMRTVPLRRYMREGEEKDPEYIQLVGPDGIVPALQFRADGSPEESTPSGPPVQSIERICGELERRYPHSFPGGAPAVRARACDGDGSIFGRLRVARRSYEACAGAAASDRIALGPLAGALLDLDAMLGEKGASSPFLEGGARPTVSDLLLLPFLERTDAVVPYFFGEGALGASGVPFGRIRAYIEGARASHPAYGALWSDATTLARTNLRYARAGQTPRYSVPSLAVDEAAAGVIDGTESAVRDGWAAAASECARREAAARLAAKPEAVGSFARRCAALPAETGDGGVGPDDAVDAALRAVAALLLRVNGDEHGEAQRAASQLHHCYGRDGAAEAAAALEALSLNVGVPRDMDVEPARALRSHARILAAALATRDT